MSIKQLLTRVTKWMTPSSIEMSNNNMKRSIIALQKSGRVVDMACSGDFINLPAGASSTYVTLPEKFRPQGYTKHFRCVNNSNLIVMYVATTGEITFYNYGPAITTATNGSFHGSWISESGGVL